MPCGSSCLRLCSAVGCTEIRLDPAHGVRAKFLCAVCKHVASYGVADVILSVLLMMSKYWDRNLINPFT